MEGDRDERADDLAERDRADLDRADAGAANESPGAVSDGIFIDSCEFDFSLSPSDSMLCGIEDTPAPDQTQNRSRSGQAVG